MSDPKPGTTIVDDIIDNALGGFSWLKSVLLGQFAPQKDLSALVAEILLNFVPGVVIVTSARDAVAITIRLANHPEKRDDILEWIFLCACLIVLALPMVMAAGGAVFAGVGAVAGGLAATQLGALFKALICMLMLPGQQLKIFLKFFQQFVKGDILKFLGVIKFIEYQRPLIETLKSTTGKLIEICAELRVRLQPFDGFEDVRKVIGQLIEWEAKFYALQTSAIKNIPKALVELDTRLKAVLAQVGLKERHTVVPGVRAKAPVVAPLGPQRVYSPVGQRFRQPPVQSALDGTPWSASGAQKSVNPTRISVSPTIVPLKARGKSPSPRATPSTTDDLSDVLEVESSVIKVRAEPGPKAVEGPNTKRQEAARLNSAFENPDLGMFRRSANQGKFATLPVAMNLKTVKSYANEAGVGLNGIKVRIIRDEAMLQTGFTGYAHPDGKMIDLYPQAFSSPEILVRTLGHERMHAYQGKVFGSPRGSAELLLNEKAAYGLEDSFVRYWRSRGGN